VKTQTSAEKPLRKVYENEKEGGEDEDEEESRGRGRKL
jgi:hypothetical protein